MILYFDNLITDIPLFPGVYSELDKIRNSNSNYKFQDRFKVTLYALMSYAEIEWSQVIVKYQLDPENKKQKKIFEKFVKKLWPKAQIIYGRSDNLSKFRETAKLINSSKDEWIFYAGNNDHPIMASNYKLLEKCLKKAKELRKKYKYVSIKYSHFPETLGMARNGTTIHDIGFPNSNIMEENEDLIVASFPREYFSADQILSKSLFNHWLFSKDFPSKINLATIKRIDYVYPFFEKNKRKNNVVILPKKEICAHFDGYSQSKGTGYLVQASLRPPLFIPRGFFERDIKIAYGYDKPREGWVNINPLKEKYSFEDPENGTDLKITLKEIPLFWKERIAKIDINPKEDLKNLEHAAKKNEEKIRNVYFTRNFWNFPFYETYIYQFRMRNLIKRIVSTIKPIGELIKKIEIKYAIKI
jgi:hypothetical protein